LGILRGFGDARQACHIVARGKRQAAINSHDESSGDIFWGSAPEHEEDDGWLKQIRQAATTTPAAARRAVYHCY